MGALRQANAIADGLEALPSAARTTGSAAVRAAANATSDAAVRRTTEVYNLNTDTVRQFVSVLPIGQDASSATVRLKIRAIPIEAFEPEIRMRRFRYTDSLGRTVDRLLPAVYLQRLRGRNARFLRPAFPLTQRTSGTLRQGESIRRRIDDRRDRLTRLRFFTFPRRYTRDDLLPLLEQAAADVLNVEVRAAYRRIGRRGLRELRRNQA